MKQCKRQSNNYNISTLLETWFLKLSYKDDDIYETIGNLNIKRIFDNTEELFFSSVIMVVWLWDVMRKKSPFCWEINTETFMDEMLWHMGFASN